MPDKHDLKNEAAAFDQRIEERSKAGYIPDLRRAVKCDYFYKSFWRDPHYIKLYLGRKCDYYLSFFEKYRGKGLKILDAGCGPGFFTLELARAGHHVTGIDISKKCIDTACKTLSVNPFTEGFGSLEYIVMSIEEMTGQYDAIIFSGVLHHLNDVQETIKKAHSMLLDDGLLIRSEPSHERWRVMDAAVVSLIRGILSACGFWYEKELADDLLASDEALKENIDEVHDEYVFERDKHEVGGQSPNDNSASGKEIISSLSDYFDQLEYVPGNSFIYRLLGGLRGEEEKIYKLADLLAHFDSYAVTAGLLEPNGFIYAGKKK